MRGASVFTISGPAMLAAPPAPTEPVQAFVRVLNTIRPTGALGRLLVDQGVSMLDTASRSATGDTLDRLIALVAQAPAAGIAREIAEIHGHLDWHRNALRGVVDAAPYVSGDDLKQWVVRAATVQAYAAQGRADQQAVNVQFWNDAAQNLRALVKAPIAFAAQQAGQAAGRTAAANVRFPVLPIAISIAVAGVMVGLVGLLGARRLRQRTAMPALAGARHLRNLTPTRRRQLQIASARPTFVIQ